MAKKPDKEDGLQRRKAGVSLQRFAGAKKSKYDKKARAERKAAINAKRVNKYRKLKKRLDGNHTEGVQHAKRYFKTPGDEDPDLQRARSRAGPPPEEANSEDMIGDASSEEDNSHETDAGVFDDAAQVQDFSAQAQLHLNEPSHGTDPAAAGIGTKTSKKKRKGPKPPSQLQRLADKMSAEKEGRQKEEAQKCRERQERQEKLQKSEKARKKQRELYLKKTKRGQPVMKYRIDNLLGKLSSELQ